jgi:prepilin-type processing-associated H-X9-DG protein
MAITWKYDAPAENETSVNVVFTSDDPEMTHTRGVNAVFVDGSYDATATEQRVSEVAMGVENKMAVGAISAEGAVDPSKTIEDTAKQAEEAESSEEDGE